MRASRWLALNLVSLAALLALAGLSAHLVVQQRSLRTDSHLLRQELAALHDGLAQYQSGVAREVAAARQESAAALAQSDAKLSAKLDSLQANLASRLAASSAELSGKVAAVQEDTGALKQGFATVQEDTGALKQGFAALKSRSEAADAALHSQLDQQASDLKTALAGVEAARVLLSTLDRSLAVGLAALGSQLDQQASDLRNALADVQAARARLDTIDAALAHRLATLDPKLQQDLRALADSVGALQKQTSALSDRTASLLMDTPSIYKKVKDAVVQVKVTKPSGEGTGSGFLYGADRRTIITAHHVIKDATTIRVVTAAGQIIFATVAGSSRERDVAVLRLPVALPATPLQLGDSDALEVGQPVMLMGSPLDEPGTATTGIVSALRRTESYEGYNVRDLIQYDAATNFGNSGGPLFNAKGEVVGIAVAIVSPASGSGINFAVPSNSVAVVIAAALR